MIQGITARILAENVPALAHFYTELLGLKVYWGDPDSIYIDLALEGEERPVLALFAKTGMSEYQGYQPLPDTSKTDDVVLIIACDDLDATYAQLSAKGVLFMGEPQNVDEWGMRCVYLRDPEENLIELYGPLK